MKTTTINDHSLRQRIIREILAVYPELPNEFYGWYLHQKVRARIAETEHKYIYPDTCLRYLRQLREDGIVNYETHRQKSLYMKIETK